MLNVFLTLIVLWLADGTYTQRVAPGVPPTQYQQPQAQYHQGQPPPPPQPGQYQQQPPNVAPQQYQQQVQYQQVPVQHVQQQQQQQHHMAGQQQNPHLQVQVPQAHTAQVLNAANIQQEREHIQEHLQVPIDTSKMSEAELQFHYFKMHDSDNNNKLDGCELIKSLIHWHGEGTHGKESKPPNETHNIYTDGILEATIDTVLKTMDLNNDGYVDYTEYRISMDASSTG